MARLYYSFNNFLKEKFGERVHKLSLDGGFSCPNLDGTFSHAGCFFCNNRAFSRFTRQNIPLYQQIKLSMEYARRRFKANKFIAYFQAFTSTYADVSVLKERYQIIKEFPEIVGLAVSTRPDCIDDKKLGLLEEFTDRYMVWLEYGLQSANNRSLQAMNRNHTYEDFLKAVEGAENRNIYLAAHIILGLPFETKEDMLDTARKISHLPLSGIKFHCLHIVEGSVWADAFKKKKMRLLNQSEYIDIVVSFLELVPSYWVVLRLISDASPQYLMAPTWINNKQEVLRSIEHELRRRNSWQGKLWS